MRFFFIAFVILALIGVVAYIKKDVLEEWLETIVSDRILHSLNDTSHDNGPSNGPSSPSEATKFAKGVGKKVLDGLQPSALLGRL
jgi:hypothetical protein